MIPNTSTGLAGPTNVLIEAITDFDEPCDHPRDRRVFYPESTRETCGKCGADVHA